MSTVDRPSITSDIAQSQLWYQQSMYGTVIISFPNSWYTFFNSSVNNELFDYTEFDISVRPMIMGLDRTYHAHRFILVSHFNFLFVPCGRLSWLPVSFLMHVKYTLSYRIVIYGKKSFFVCISWRRVARETMFVDWNGDRPLSPNYLVLITDGRSNNRTLTWLEAVAAREQAITILVVSH